MEKKSSFEDVIARLHLLYGTYKIKELIEKLGVVRSTYDGWRNKGEIPKKRLYRIAEEKGVNLDWLLHGIGQKYKVEEIGKSSIGADLESSYTKHIAKLFDALPPAKQERVYKKIKNILLEELR